MKIPLTTSYSDPCSEFQNGYRKIEHSNISLSNEISKQESDCIDYKEGKNEDFNGMNECKGSDLQQFYNRKNVLITGVTGCLGKILVEKLLRSCPGVENLYLLVREKRGKDIHSRMDEIFDDPMFNRLKKENPKFRHKVVAIQADCNAAGLGLSTADRQMLIEKVNIIFHSAAAVKFDEHLRAALTTNVLASLQLLSLAREMRLLEVFMHVSTAYSNPHLSFVEERFYDCSTDLDQLQRQLDKLTDAGIDDVLPQILGPWPNTYTFTKALTEKELRTNACGLPVGIFRPAIVTSTAKEPLKGWIGNMYGPTGIAVGSMTGILHTLQILEKNTAEIVPVDYVVNCLLTAAFSVHKENPTEPLIFNYVSSVENRITWADFVNLAISRLNDYPFSNAMWYMSLTLTSSSLVNGVKVVLLHIIPALLLDGLAICLGRKPEMIKIYYKYHKFSSALTYFLTKKIEYCNKRVRELWDNTSDYDKEIFPFSMAEISWSSYFDEYQLGIRRYLLKESDHSLPQARRKWKRLYCLHQTVKVFFSILTIYSLWLILIKFWLLLFSINYFNYV